MDVAKREVRHQRHPSLGSRVSMKPCYGATGAYVRDSQGAALPDSGPGPFRGPDLRHEHLPQLESRHVVGITAQQDVRTATRHVGGDGHCTLAPRLRHDLTLTLHVLRLGIKYLVRGGAG